MNSTSRSTKVIIAGAIAISTTFVSGCATEVSCNTALQHSTLEIFLADDWEDAASLSLHAECSNPDECELVESAASSAAFIVSDPDTVEQIHVRIDDERTGEKVLEKLYDISWRKTPAVSECGSEWSEAQLSISSRDAAN